MVPWNMPLKEIKRTAVVAWSPPLHSLPLLATGTLAGAMDASFSTLAELEIYELGMDNRSTMEPVERAVVSAPARFNRLVWSPQTGNAFQDGILAGGLEDGSLAFWNVSELFKQNTEGALLARSEGHRGPVRGLEVNPFQPFLLASGAVESEVFLWDLNNLSTPYMPSSNKSSKLEDITDLAWNRLVPHILATASNSGYTVIWDLKGRKEIMQLAAPGQRQSLSAVAWNPEVATQIVIASDDDQNPAIYSWDLRNARAPEKTLIGHTKGVLSLAWCPKDAELLLSCGKDNKSICWNPQTATVVAELTHSENWMFDVQWCPRNPDLFATASFDGKIEVHSFQGIMSGAGRTLGTQKGTGEDFFSTGGVAAQARPAVPASIQIPKWLRRPIGVSFGFGGRLVTFSSLKADTARIVNISTLLPTVADYLLQESTRLDMALNEHTISDYCTSKIKSSIPSLHFTDTEAVFWNVARILFDKNPQEKLLNLLAFDTHKIADKIRSFSFSDAPLIHDSASDRRSTGSSPVIAPPKTSTSPSFPKDGPVNDFFGAGLDQPDEVDFSALVAGSLTEKAESLPEKHQHSQPHHQPAQQSPGISTFSLFSPEASEIDRTITRAIILGDFESAVELCVKTDRLSDALLVAICGGPELVAKTQQIYFQRAKHPYMRVVSAIVQNDLSDVVQNASLEHWEEILALICTSADGRAFATLCNTLGARLESACQSNSQLYMASLICYMVSGNATKALSLILATEASKHPSPSTFYEYSLWLEGIVEKARILEQSEGYLIPGEEKPIQVAVPEISDYFLQYSFLMASSGMLDIAVRYFNTSKSDLDLNGEADLVALFADRLAGLTGGMNLTFKIRPVPRLFESASVQVVSEFEKQSAPAPSFATAGSAAIQWSRSAVPGPQPTPGQPGPYATPHTSGLHPSQPMGPYEGATLMTTQPVAPPPTASIPGPVPMPTRPAPPFAASAAIPPVSMLSAASPSTRLAPAPPVLAQVPQRGQFAPVPHPAIPSAAISAIHSIPSPVHATSPQPPAPSMMGAPQQPTVPFPSAAPPMTALSPTSVIPSGMPLQPPLSTANAMVAGSASGNVAPLHSKPALHPSPPPSASFIPAPPRPIMTPPPQDGSLRRPAGGYNDPPIVAPRVPAAPTPVERPPMMQPFVPSAPTAASTQAMAPQPVPSETAKSSAAIAPVDPSKIPANLLPIYQTFSNLMNQCQQRAMPMQRRVVEDSARRLQSLFHQLAAQELSPPVINLLNEMCAGINNGQYDHAHELHLPLMTNHFTEAGAWVLAAKRLIEVARTCLH